MLAETLLPTSRPLLLLLNARTALLLVPTRGRKALDAVLDDEAARRVVMRRSDDADEGPEVIEGES